MYLTLKDLLPLIACNSDLIITKHNLEFDEFSDRNQEPEFIQLFNSHVDCYLDLKKFEIYDYRVELVSLCDRGIKILVIESGFVDPYYGRH